MGYFEQGLQNNLPSRVLNVLSKAIVAILFCTGDPKGSIKAALMGFSCQGHNQGNR